MRRRDAVDEVRTLGRRTNRLVVVVMLIAFWSVSLEVSVLTHPPRGAPDIDAFYVSVLLDLLSLIAVCGQLLALARWSAWAALAAWLLRGQGISALDERRFGGIRNLRRPAWVASELVQVSTAAATWAGEWVGARVPPIVRAWWAAWSLRMIAGLAIVLASVLAPRFPTATGGVVAVACILRDLALLTAGPLLIIIVSSVGRMLEQARADT